MTARLFLPALALALILSGCDATDTVDVSDLTDLEDAAAVIAQSVSLDAGGVLSDASEAAKRFESDSGPAGCTTERDYDDSGTWNVSVACERGNPDGRFYHTFAREATYRFLDADGQPQETPRGAQTLEHSILSGSGTHLTPRASAVLSSLTADYIVTRADSGMATVNGASDRAGIQTVYGRREAQREVDYALSLELDDVTGPRARRADWRGAVSGTVTGVYTATITLTAPGGETRTREVARDFTITFPNGGRRARIAMGGQTFDADPATGELL